MVTDRSDDGFFKNVGGEPKGKQSGSNQETQQRVFESSKPSRDAKTNIDRQARDPGEISYNPDDDDICDEKTPSENCSEYEDLTGACPSEECGNTGSFRAQKTTAGRTTNFNKDI